MQVYKFNSVFDHVAITLHELFDKNPKFDKTLFVLGYNILKDLNFLRQQYKGYKIIIYQLEQLHDKSHWVNKQSYNNLKQADVYTKLDISKQNFYKAIRTKNFENPSLQKILNFLSIKVGI